MNLSDLKHAINQEILERGDLEVSEAIIYFENGRRIQIVPKDDRPLALGKVEEIV